MQLDPTSTVRAGGRRPVRRSARRRALDALRVRNAGVVYALILLVAVLTAATAATGRPSYVGGDNVANILDQTSLVGILAIFMTVVLISGNFDLSVASIAAFSGAVALSVIDDHGFVFALVLALAAGTLIGLVNGVIVQYVGINAFIVTLGTMTAVRGLVLILTDGRTITVTKESSFDSLGKVEAGFWTTPDVLVVLGVLAVVGAAALELWRRRGGARGGSGRRPLVVGGAGVVLLVAGAVSDLTFRFAKPVYYLVALTLIVWIVLRFTVVGRRLYAVGANPEAARLSGIRMSRYKIVPFVLTGLAAAFIGFLYGAKLGAVNPTALSGTELTVIAAAILGGTSLFGGSGSVVMSVVGAVFLYTIANGFNVLDLGANYQGLIQGTVIIIAAAVYTVASRRRAAMPEAEAGPGDPVAGADDEEAALAPTHSAVPHA